MNIKKIFSGIVSAVMLFSFSAQYIVRNETAMASGSKGSLTAGLFTAFCGLVLGSVYLLTNRKAKLTYALLCIIFIL